MTVEATNEVKVVPEVELEQNIALISNPADDLVNAGDSNGVLSEHAEGIVGETKEDAENSYVFVSGNSDHGGVGDRSCPDPSDRDCGGNALTREVDRDEKKVLAENPGKLNLPIEVEEDKEPEIIVPEVVKAEEPTIVSEDIPEGTSVVLEAEQEVENAIDDTKLDSEVANRSAVSEDCLLSNADVESEVAIASVEIEKLGDIKNDSVQAGEIELEARIGFVSIIEDPNASVEIEKLGDIKNDSVQADEIKLEARIGFVSIIEDPNIETERGGNSIIDESMHTADISNGFDEDISNGFVSTVEDPKIETGKGGDSVKVEESVHAAPEELKFEKEISNGFVSTVEDPKKDTEMASHSVKIEENMHTAAEEHEFEKEISNGSVSAIEDPKVETEMGSEESIHAAAEEHKLQTENNNGFVSSVEDPKIETYLVGNGSVKLEESTDNVAEEKKSEKEISNGFFYTIDPMIESETGNGSVDFEESVPTAEEENQFEKEISVSDDINSTSCVSPVKNVKSAIEDANVSAGIECTLVEGNGSMGNGSLKLEESTDNVAEEKKSEKEISNGFFYTIEDPIIESETGNGSVDFEESMLTAGEENQFEKEISDSDEINSTSCVSPAKNVKSAIEDANVSAGIECTLVDGNGSMGNGESLLLSPVKVESGVEVSNGHVENDQSSPLPISREADLESEDNSKCLPTCPVDLGSGAEARKVSVESHEEGFTGEVDDTKVESDASVVSIAEHEGQSAIREEDERLSAEDIEGYKGVPQNETTISSQVDSTCASSGAETVDVEMLKKLPNYIIRVPRYVDDELGAKIKQFQFEVDQKTQQRDSIRTALQAEKVTCAQFWDNVVAARSEERAAREAVNAKYREMDSVQLIINKMNNATSIEKINDKIDGMEHRIQHETMQLKEEKLLIREIKQLKQVREQLCANMGTPAELQEAFDQINSIDERFKLLKQELDSLRSKLWHTESVTKAAKKKHSDECDNLKNLQIQFRNADSLRQQAYAELRSLKKQIYEKNKYFYMYKDDQKAAADLASAGDREALRRFCSDQVEKFMDLWNKNDEFRNQYVKHNVMSTVRRLRTLDGRSLGPDEEPPVILRHPVEKTDSSTFMTSAKINTAVIPETLCAPVTPEKGESKSVIEVGPNKLSAKSKKTTKSISAETVPTTVPSRVEEVDKESEKEQKPTKEPEELVNKEEELKKQEVAAMLREQRRLEEIAKAKEAAERKKRNAEKAQARAELRAKKEAELKEKEREKRAKKKEKKREAQADSSSGSVDGDSAQVSSDKNASETAEEPERSTKEKPANVVRRYSKSMAATKSKPLPPLPLRNRGKRRMQAWMWWALFAAVLLVVMFLAVSGMFRISLSNLGF